MSSQQRIGGRDQGFAAAFQEHSKRKKIRLYIVLKRDKIVTQGYSTEGGGDAMGIKVTGAELEIMQHLWAQPDNNTFAQLLTWFNEEGGKQWTKQTLNTNLLRLTKRGLLERVDKAPKSVYVPTVDEVRYEQLCAKEILEESYDGKLANFIAAFSGGQRLTSEEEENLMRFIEEKERV